VGAFLISALFLSIFIIIYRLIEKTAYLKYALILSFLPIGFLLLLQNRYNFPLVIAVKYLFALIFFLLYIKIENRYRGAAIFLSGLLYYILAGWTYLFLVVLCMQHELFFSKGRIRYLYTVLLIVVYVLYPFIAARCLFVITLNEAYLYIVQYEFFHKPFMFKPNLVLYLFFLSLPVLLKAIFIFSRCVKLKVTNPTHKDLACPARGTDRSEKLLSRLNPLLVQSIIIVLIGCLILKLSFDDNEKKKIQIDCLADQGKWQELLILSSQIDEYDRMVNFNFNRAQYHTGRLLDNLFSYTQVFGTDGLFINKIIASQIAIPASDLYFELGHINASQVMAYEEQTKFKYNPRILKRLAQINIINEKYIVAKKFLDLLSKSIIYRKWAKRYENYLSNESLIASDSLIQLKRSQQPKFDFFIDTKGPNVDLVMLLKENKDNKMAFEYLMAYYLLDCNMGSMMKHLSKAKNFGYKKIPRHIEEALLLIKALFPSRININEYGINPYTIERFLRFNTILQQNSGNEKKAKELLQKKFSDTYWYYVRYVSPKRTKLELKAIKIDEDLY
jgi:hypothetical protein